MSFPKTPRTLCALQGAVSVASAIEGVVPVVHSTSGCALQGYLAGSLANGAAGIGLLGGWSVPSTNVTEKHVIFGGTSRLREQLKNTIKVMEGKFFLIISGCAPTLVGDDSAAMAKEINDQGWPTTSVQASGLHGNAYSGYQLVFRSLVERLAPEGVAPLPQEKGLVNLLGVVPGQDSLWEGDLHHLGDALAKAGFVPNRLFGCGQTLKNWERIPAAEVNAVVSPWGLEIAEYLKGRFGTPFVRWDHFPVGPGDTTRWLLEVAAAIGAPEERVRLAAEESERSFGYFLRRFSDAYFNLDFQTGFSVVGPVAQAVGISRFLDRELGFHADAVVGTDHAPLQVTAVEELLGGKGGGTIVALTENRFEIESILRRATSGLVLASSHEAKIAETSGAAHLSISFPVTDRLLLRRGYAGYAGALNLLEDVGTTLLLRRRRRSEGNPRT
jgi:nitrogenase molybdenum-iron protein beta chain